MTASFAVEPATIEDLDALVNLWIDLVESQMAYGSHILGEPNRTTGRDILAQYVSGEMVAVARSTEPSDADVPNPLLGFVMFHRESGLYEQQVERGIVENLYVVPSARRSGIGSALLAHAEGELVDRGAEVVTLSVMAENEVGREFYGARGYRPHRVVYERDMRGDTTAGSRDPSDGIED